MQIVYAMEVIDPLERPDGTRYVGRFRYETREEVWTKYSEAIRFGFEAYVEKVGRMRVTSQTSAHEHLGRSSAADRRGPREGASWSHATAAAAPSASVIGEARRRHR